MEICDRCMNIIIISVILHGRELKVSCADRLARLHYKHQKTRSFCYRDVA